MSELPSAVSNAFDAWSADGGQRPVGWSAKAWARWFPDRDVFRRLANPVGRADVVPFFQKITDEESATDAFIAAMIWGFGRVGYGPYRTRRILDENTGSATRLLSVAKTTIASGGPAGFADMAEAPLKYLGVAFGTKYLYFCSRAAGVEVPDAPVLDRIVRWWLASETNVELDIWTWNVADYGRYCLLLEDWGSQRGLAAGDAEEAIFEYALQELPVTAREGKVVALAGAGPRDVSELLSELTEAAAELPSLAEEEQARAAALLEELRGLLTTSA